MKKKSKLTAKYNLELLDKRVNASEAKLRLANDSVKLISKNYKEINHEIFNLEQELESLKSSGATHDDSLIALDRLINSNRKEIRRLTNEIYAIEVRASGINQIVHEINTEIETLNLNEEARRIFLSFNEICGSGSCGLFSSSSRSYSKNLLYLKDQIKDLHRNSDKDKARLENLNQQKVQLESVIASIIDERNKIAGKSEMSALVDSISEIKNRIFKLSSQRDELESLIELENKHISIIRQRDSALEKYQSYSAEKKHLPSLLKNKIATKRFVYKMA
ncbi:hypothetical protein [Shewanella algae]|uniref:Uncharacterized protein n=1 Tax=Shewanella algae TaxID=38313 RepID=A0AAD1NNT4_9GAMM|nr:hypothetical protein [Shewanella algae]BCV46608.1 hypothetical protein TUM17379_36260 [Shewanella algae]